MGYDVKNMAVILFIKYTGTKIGDINLKIKYLSLAILNFSDLHKIYSKTH